MLWYLLDASDSSLCIVFEKNILQAGRSPLEISEEVTFFYQGKQYSGRILAKNRDRDALDAEMNKMLKESRAKKTQSLVSKEIVSGKRKITAPIFYGNQAGERQKKPEQPKMSEEEKTRQRILERNKKEAERRSNRGILSKTNAQPEEQVDPSWVPSDDDRSMDSIIYDRVAHDKELSKSKSSIVRKLLANEGGSSSDENPSPPSPSKDELKKQLDLLRKQLDQQKAATSNSSNKTESGSSKQEEVNKDWMEEDEGRNKHNSTEVEDMIDRTSSAKDDGEYSHDNSLNEPTDSSKRKRKHDKDLSHDLLDDLAEMSNHEHLDGQLYGEASDTKELAKLGIFCKASDLGRALSGSTNVKHLLRRLMEGVFNPEKIMNCTVTGQSWHAGGAAARAAKPDPLHPKALRAIVDFSNAIAKSKKWSKIKYEEARPVFAIKLTEMKKKARK